MERQSACRHACSYLLHGKIETKPVSASHEPTGYEWQNASMVGWVIVIVGGLHFLLRPQGSSAHLNCDALMLQAQLQQETCQQAGNEEQNSRSQAAQAPSWGSPGQAWQAGREHMHSPFGTQQEKLQEWQQAQRYVSGLIKCRFCLLRLFSFSCM